MDDYKVGQKVLCQIKNEKISQDIWDENISVPTKEFLIIGICFPGIYVILTDDKNGFVIKDNLLSDDKIDPIYRDKFQIHINKYSIRPVNLKVSSALANPSAHVRKGACPLCKR